MALVLLLFVAFELMLRLCGVGYDTRLIIKSASNANGFRFNPAFDRSYYGLEDLSGPDPRTFEIPKPPGTFRIVVVGGSTVAGFPYPAELALPRHLEIVLNEQFKDSDGIQYKPATPAADEISIVKFEVLNAGMIAIMSLGELDVVQQVLDCKPDLVVIHSGHNEFYGPGGSASNVNSYVPGLFSAVKFLKRQRTYQTLFSLIHRPQKKHLVESLPADVGIPLNSDKFKETRDRFRTNLSQMVDTIVEAGCAVMLSTVPSNLRDLAPMQPTKDPAAESYLRQALMRVSYSEYDKALAELSEAKRAAPSDPLVRYREAQCLEALGRRGEAAEAFATAADLDGFRLRASRPVLEVPREIAIAKQVSLCDVDRELKGRSRFPAPGSDFFLEHVHFSLEGAWEVATILGQAITEQILHQTWRPEQLPITVRRDELLELMALDRIAADSLATAIFDAWPFNLSTDNKRMQQLLLARIAANFQSVQPIEREAFSLLPMPTMESHLWLGMGENLLAAGHPDKALAAFQRHIRRQPENRLGYQGTARALELLNRHNEAEEMRQLAPPE